MNILYIETDMLEYNHLFNKISIWSEDIKEDFSGMPNIKIPLPPMYIELDEDLDFIIKVTNIIEILKEFYVSSDPDEFFKSKQINLTFYLPIHDYTHIFPLDTEFQDWQLGGFLQKKKSNFFLNLDFFFKYSLEYDLLERLNMVHVVRSYISKFIWFGLKTFLYFYVYYHFPKYYYFTDYFRKNVIPRYFLTKNLVRNTKFFWKYIILRRVTLPALEEFGFTKSFLSPKEPDKKYPWIDFTIKITYKPFPFIDIHIIWELIYSTLEWHYYLFNKVASYTNDLLVYDFIKDNNPVLNIFLKSIEFENQMFFFTKNTYFNLAKILQKKWMAKFFLPTFLWILKKQNFLFLLADTLFFSLNFKEFKMYDWYRFFLKKKRGRPKKKEFFYFESEKELFENWKSFNKLNTAKYWYHTQNVSYVQFKNNFFLSWFLLRQLIFNFEKPF